MCPLARRGFNPNLAAVSLNGPGADCEADACALVFPASVQAFERGEDLLGIFRLDANSVISYPENQLPVNAFSGQANKWLAVAGELQRV